MGFEEAWVTKHHIKRFQWDWDPASQKGYNTNVMPNIISDDNNLVFSIIIEGVGKWSSRRWVGRELTRRRARENQLANYVELRNV